MLQQFYRLLGLVLFSSIFCRKYMLDLPRSAAQKGQLKRCSLREGEVAGGAGGGVQGDWLFMEIK